MTASDQQYFCEIIWFSFKKFDHAPAWSDYLVLPIIFVLILPLDSILILYLRHRRDYFFLSFETSKALPIR